MHCELLDIPLMFSKNSSKPPTNIPDDKQRTIAISLAGGPKRALNSISRFVLSSDSDVGLVESDRRAIFHKYKNTKLQTLR